MLMLCLPLIPTVSDFHCNIRLNHWTRDSHQGRQQLSIPRLKLSPRQRDFGGQSPIWLLTQKQKKRGKNHSQITWHKKFTFHLSISKHPPRNSVNKCAIVRLDPLAGTIDALYLPGYRKECRAQLFVLQNLRALAVTVQREWRDSRLTLKSDKIYYYFPIQMPQWLFKRLFYQNAKDICFGKTTQEKINLEFLKLYSHFLGYSHTFAHVIVVHLTCLMQLI